MNATCSHWVGPEQVPGQPLAGTRCGKPAEMFVGWGRLCPEHAAEQQTATRLFVEAMDALDRRGER